MSEIHPLPSRLPSPLPRLTLGEREVIRAGIIEGLREAILDSKPVDPKTYPGFSRWARIVRHVHPRLTDELIGSRRIDPQNQPQFITRDGLRIVFCSGYRDGQSIVVRHKGEVSRELIRRNSSRRHQLTLFSIETPQQPDTATTYTIFVTYVIYTPDGADTDSPERRVKVVLGCPEAYTDECKTLICQDGWIEDFFDELLVEGDIADQPQSVPIEVIVLEKSSS